jgi:hypothetical protein
VGKERVKKSQSRIVLCDLAGSERDKDAQHTTEKGKREMAKINQSLCHLQKVLLVLSEPPREGNKPPFRGQRLTEMLSHTLDPAKGAKALMILNCSQADNHDTQTAQTLKYGEEAKKRKAGGSKPK